MLNLNEMKSKELKEMAKELGVKNWWLLKKSELVDGIVFAIADKEDAGEEVDVEALINTSKTETSNTEVVPEVETEKEVDEEPTEVDEEPIEKPKPKRGALIEFDGRAQNICAWGKELNISPNTLYGRIYKMGWSVERAFTTPARRSK